MSLLEDPWKSKFILGPLHPSDMAYKMCNSLICLKTAKETCFRLFYYPALKYPLGLLILLGKGGCSAKMTIVRALRAAEAAMPLRGDNLPGVVLPKPRVLQTKEEQSLAAVPSAHNWCGRKHCAAYGKYLVK